MVKQEWSGKVHVAEVEPAGGIPGPAGDVAVTVREGNAVGELRFVFAAVQLLLLELEPIERASVRWHAAQVDQERERGRARGVPGAHQDLVHPAGQRVGTRGMGGVELRARRRRPPPEAGHQRLDRGAPRRDWQDRLVMDRGDTSPYGLAGWGHHEAAASKSPAASRMAFTPSIP